MLLLIDVGNTQTVIGVSDSRTAAASQQSSPYIATWRIGTDKSATTDDIVSRLMPLLDRSSIKVGDIDRVAVSSVVPFLTTSWQHAAIKLFGVEPICCNAKTASSRGLFEADYPAPDEIGADRVADAVAARAIYGAPVIVVDFGTATNIEVIDERGCFIGGVIAPGIITGADALFSNATQIATTGFVVPPNPIGKSTAQAVQSGIIYGEVGRVDGLLKRIFDVLGSKCPVVATGGLSHTVSRLSTEITDVRSELTLDGLLLLAEELAS